MTRFEKEIAAIVLSMKAYRNTLIAQELKITLDGFEFWIKELEKALDAE